jgi:ubiquinone biosynthesis protein
VGTSGGCFVRSGRRATVCDKTSRKDHHARLPADRHPGYRRQSLLGIRLSWPRRLLAAFLGVSGGTAIAFLLSGWRPPQDPSTIEVPPPAIWAWSLLATMAAVGLFELAARPGQVAGLMSAVLRSPRVIGDIRRRIQRSRRYLQVTGIAARHGLGEQLHRRKSGSAREEPLPTGARDQRIGRALRLTLEDAGGHS